MSDSHRRFEYRFRIALHDTDAAGVLFYGHLFRHAHDAYERFMASIGHDLADLIAGPGPALPIVHAEADYRAPLRHGDAVRVTVHAASVSERSFRLAYRFYGSSGDLRAEAATVHAAVDRATGRATHLPDGLRTALTEAVPG